MANNTDIPRKDLNQQVANSMRITQSAVSTNTTEVSMEMLNKITTDMNNVATSFMDELHKVKEGMKQITSWQQPMENDMLIYKNQIKEQIDQHTSDQKMTKKKLSTNEKQTLLLLPSITKMDLLSHKFEGIKEKIGELNSDQELAKIHARNQFDLINSYEYRLDVLEDLLRPLMRPRLDDNVNGKEKEKHVGEYEDLVQETYGDPWEDSDDTEEVKDVSEGSGDEMSDDEEFQQDSDHDSESSTQNGEDEDILEDSNSESFGEETRGKESDEDDEEVSSLEDSEDQEEDVEWDDKVWSDYHGCYFYELPEDLIALLDYYLVNVWLFNGRTGTEREEFINRNTWPISRSLCDTNANDPSAECRIGALDIVYGFRLYDATMTYGEPTLLRSCSKLKIVSAIEGLMCDDTSCFHEEFFKSVFKEVFDQNLEDFIVYKQEEPWIHTYPPEPSLDGVGICPTWISPYNSMKEVQDISPELGFVLWLIRSRLL